MKNILITNIRSLMIYQTLTWSGCLSPKYTVYTGKKLLRKKAERRASKREAIKASSKAA